MKHLPKGKQHILVTGFLASEPQRVLSDYDDASRLQKIAALSSENRIPQHPVFPMTVVIASVTPILPDSTQAGKIRITYKCHGTSSLQNV